MYCVLLLRDILEDNCRVKDYLQLSGYYVIEKELKSVNRFEAVFEQSDMIIIESDELQMCFNVSREIRIRTQIPIIVLSTSDDEWEKIRLFRAGIDDYLVKPYWQGELLARIQSHIERYRRLTRPFGVIEVGELEINAFSRKVCLKGEVIDMRSKEFDVLLFLAQHLNQVVTKEAIYAAVWGDELADGFYSSVAVHVKRVREKIEENIDSPKYIETVWGVGYSFRSYPSK